MALKTFVEDSRLDILVFGPMAGPNEKSSSTAVIGKALNLLLAEKSCSDLLKANRIKDYEIHIPQDWNEPEIVKGILSRLDIADLAIVNLTPKTGFLEDRRYPCFVEIIPLIKQINGPSAR
ncbi:MAG TPA: hypothetical protein VK563_05375 [Puia sp.]|nr:hypothetical protein [Puia sp.]